nr:anti-repressor SinI family protein [Halobacillus sp. Marseille-P3879]
MKQKRVDQEWVQLIKEAKRLGLEIEDVRKFLRRKLR